MSDIDTGLNVWQMNSNHNRMIEIQNTRVVARDGPVEIAFYGSSAFKITSPQGVSVMIDPWRNHPSRAWDWYFHDFPITQVDIGTSTHAHFDHDALHRLDAHVLLDRLIGSYTFADMSIHGLADKHETDSSCAIYDYKKIHERFHGTKIEPPNNPRSWDHCLIVVETGGLRIVHWGDNRHNPPPEIWAALGHIDIALLPVDNSQHVMGFEMVEHIIETLRPHVVIPHHYYIWDVLQRQSTLQGAQPWVERHAAFDNVDGPRRTYAIKDIKHLDRAVHFFGDHVAFDREAWHEAGR
jgi:L-ascorbate metabolism protein UlaG (beta-lactamase superfamily)